MPQYVYIFHKNFHHYSRHPLVELYTHCSNGDLIAIMVGGPVKARLTGRKAENLILRLYDFQVPVVQRLIDEILREWESTSTTQSQ